VLFSHSMARVNSCNLLLKTKSSIWRTFVPSLFSISSSSVLRRIRAISPRVETRARTRVSLPRGRGGEQGSDGCRRTKSETQAVPQSREVMVGREEERGEGRCGRSISVHLPALTFAMPSGDSWSDCSKRIAGSRWKWFNFFHKSTNPL